MKRALGLVTVSLVAAAGGCAAIAGIQTPSDRMEAGAGMDANSGSSSGGSSGSSASSGSSSGGGSGSSSGGGCDAISCRNGCCNGSTCVLYSLQAAEGGGGVECGTCTGGCCAHVNANTTDSGLGQTFFDCEPLCDAVDNGGSGTKCTSRGAQDACNAFLASRDAGTDAGNCAPCQAGGQYVYSTYSAQSINWTYYEPDASLAGQVFQNAVGQNYCADVTNTGIYWR